MGMKQRIQEFVAATWITLGVVTFILTMMSIYSCACHGQTSIWDTDPQVQLSYAAPPVAISLWGDGPVDADDSTPPAPGPAPPSPSPSPTPTPAPQPGDICKNCRGTGRSGDGISPCIVCGGDGKMSMPDYERKMDELQAEVDELRDHSLVKQYTPLPVWINDVTAAKNDAASTGMPVLAYITAESCGPCKILERDVLASSDFVGSVDERFILLEIDAEHDAIAKKWNIHKIPQMRVITSDWTTYRPVELYESDGKFVSPSEISEQLDSWYDWANEQAARKSDKSTYRSDSTDLPVRTVQYSYSGGPVTYLYGNQPVSQGYSQGSSGGAYEYSQPATTYYYQQPVRTYYYSPPSYNYYRPSYNYAPSYGYGYGYGYSSGRMVCGPSGCYIQ